MPEIEISEGDRAAAILLMPYMECDCKDCCAVFAEAFAAHRTAATTAERERIVAKLAAAREQLREAHGNETAAGFDWAIAIVTGGKSPAIAAPGGEVGT